ncbi:histidinol dehydrogenase [candidate division MSBL1 archaeon SCGC-AAA382F02]|uniref:Histidinol dehydrogenase n=1 Tax=candidate division MSBL1 archaeon SCGC-AAA382F02 TaxID=1698282 RepID=A0A133VIL1_9EURY|nr:histidinol dehydrogenase [candidate division MSBL1 archaeon SCGC-AAA382F02]
MRLWKHPERRRKTLLKRSEGDVAEVLPKVEKIVSEVRRRGDIALLEFTKKFDGVELTREQLQVSEQEISQAYEGLPEEDIEAIKKAANSIEKYHKNQIPKDWMKKIKSGVKAGQVVRPLEFVGIYTPGGTAQYPSSVLMAAVPAKVAGIDKTIMCTPSDSEGKISSATLVAADVAEVDEIYKAGGAQAIAAMAYGSRTIPSVDKIVGPGNVYVAAAKKIVSADVDIDFMAGPSEVLILADSSADSRLVALDLVAQAEHDSSAAAVLVTTSEKLAENVLKESKSILEEIPRRRTAAKALQEYGHLVVVRSPKRAFEFVNDYAPEHLQLMVRDPEKKLDNIKNAGAIFLGPYSTVPAGDFAVGPSHILPTGGDARIYDGLSVSDFVRLPSVQKLTKKGLEGLSETIERLAEMEGLTAHARSVRKRIESD